MGVVDTLEEEGDLETEHAALDDHEDGSMACMLHRLAHLVTAEEQAEKPKLDPRRSLQRRLLHLDGNLRKVSVGGISP